MQTKNCGDCIGSGQSVITKPIIMREGTGVRPQKINRGVAQSCYLLQGKCGASVKLDVAEIAMIIKSSTGKALIEYPAFSLDDDGAVCFYWDSLLYDLPNGRYFGDILIGDDTVATVQFSQDSGVSLSSVSHVERTHEVDCDD